MKCDKNPKSCQHCQILQKHERLSMDSMLKFHNSILAPRLLQQFIRKNPREGGQTGGAIVQYNSETPLFFFQTCNSYLDYNFNVNETCSKLAIEKPKMATMVIL